MTTADYKTSVREYFRVKADAYDLVDEQAYWRLSDSLLWDTLKATVLDRLPDGFRFLDAGGGTGRWSDRIARHSPLARGVLHDLSPDMAHQAKLKALAGGYDDRLEIVIGDLNRVDRVHAGRSFDLIFNFHNVLGFVDDPDAVVRSFASLLAPGGFLVSFVPNRYHAAFFNVARGRLDEAHSAVTASEGRFTDEMPAIKLFTPADLTRLYTGAGLETEVLTGFPVSIYPGYQETQLRGQSGRLAELLGDPESFEAIHRLESSLLLEPDVAARGNNLFAVGCKP